jgi:2-polyprenyl-3-methyl-5-hydroxy-6-metoxy-1,4-benzoquinol methylase
MEKGNCAICSPGGQAENFLQARSGESLFSYMRCSACGLVFLNPRPGAAEMFRFYDEDYYGEGDQKFRSGVEVLRRFFAREKARRACRYFPSPGTVLDVGCGQGTFLRLMQRKGWKGQGTELSPGSASRAIQAGLSVSVGEIGENQFPPFCFDLITFWQVLEHLRDPAAMLERIRPLLRRGGIVAISTPNVESWQARTFRGDWFHLDAPRHLFLFSPRTLETIMTAHGFRLLTLSHFSWEQNPYGWLQSFLNRVGFSKNSLYTLIKDGSPGRKRRFTAAVQGKIYILSAALLPLCVFLSAVTGISRRGETIEAYFRLQEVQD